MIGRIKVGLENRDICKKEGGEDYTKQSDRKVGREGRRKQRDEGGRRGLYKTV